MDGPPDKEKQHGISNDIIVQPLYINSQWSLSSLPNAIRFFQRFNKVYDAGPREPWFCEATLLAKVRVNQ